MKAGYTHICVVLDRSGSMESIREDTIGGFNAFVEEQRRSPGVATLSLVQFDTENAFEVVHSFVPLADVPRLSKRTFVPRGGTPLFDAIGRTINDTEAQIAKLAEFARPDAVIIAIITDGGENSSREFGREDIVKMLEAKEKEPGWKIVFLSADMSAVEEAVSNGIRPSRSRAFDKTGQGTREAWGTLSSEIDSLRSGKSDDIDFRR